MLPNLSGRKEGFRFGSLMDAWSSEKLLFRYRLSLGLDSFGIFFDGVEIN
jgi:hypothetical protein